MPFRLLTLGPPALLDPASSPVDLPLGKPFALLVYLAIERSPVSRDDLATLFWGGVGRERARQSVRQALWLLRRTLGPEAFRSEDPVELSPACVSVDLADLRTALSAGDVATALTLWQGTFVERFAIGGARGWQLWVEDQRDAAENAFVAALLEAATAERDAGRLGAAVELLRRTVGVAPHKGTAHGLLIESLLDAHEFEAAGVAIAEARRQFGDATRSIDFGRFDERLSSGRANLARGRTRPELSTEFVGRARELADLLGLWRSARAGHTRAMLIRGPTGIGKSRLSAEAAAGADEGTVVAVKASEAERDIEHGLAATLVRRLLRLRGAAGVSGASDAVLRALVPSLSNGNAHGGQHRNGEVSGEPDAQPAGPVSTVALADALADLIGAVAEESPLLVVLDNVQWADTSSRSVLASLLRRMRDAPCLFLLTARPEESSTRGSPRSASRATASTRTASTFASRCDCPAALRSRRSSASSSLAGTVNPSASVSATLCCCPERTATTRTTGSTPTSSASTTPPFCRRPAIRPARD